MSTNMRLYALSGTSGKPIVVGYTAQDIDTWSNLMARNRTIVEIGQDDIFQNAVNYVLFTNGLGIHFGIEKIGVVAIPSGTGNTTGRIDITSGCTAI